jgi:hypothetical protein
MIHALSINYKQHIAYILLCIFYLQLILPLQAGANNYSYYHENYSVSASRLHKNTIAKPSINNSMEESFHRTNTPEIINKQTFGKLDIGGPSSPEATSFKAVGSDNLVNLFTGDFSYSVPLLDVGGYPVNLFYSGGISMEQEASWVGLGWNINPGTVSRNMRGVPDDFNGEDKLSVTQKTKPNRTWGGDIGVDGELFGKKKPNVSFSLGASYNNYLGPALELGASLSIAISRTESIKMEKNASGGTDTSSVSRLLNANVGLGGKLSSRSGFTLSPSLSASLPLSEKGLSLGAGLSTSYNSRTGISSLNLHSELSHYIEQYNGKVDGVIQSKASSISTHIGSSTISFAKPSFMPSMRMPMRNAYTAGQVELGGGFFGSRISATLNGYYSESKVAPDQETVQKPLVGYMYSEKANSNPNAVMDLNRINDAEVTPNTPVISAPQYTYDVFSIQGEGTGGSIRAFRGDLGFMRDNVTNSTDASLSLGADIAPPGHFGVNVNTVSSPTRVGGWENSNNTLRTTMAFVGKQTGIGFENVYFRNPGEVTVTNPEILDRVGRDSLVKFRVSGSNALPRIESQLELYSKKGDSYGGFRPIANNVTLKEREKRTQVTTMLTANDAAIVGLEKYIRTYKTGNSLIDANTHTIVYDSFPRVDGNYRKGHHISEIDVLEQNGMRYVYGIPVYNRTQKDFTFSVSSMPNTNTNQVAYDSTNEPTLQSNHMTNRSNVDGYLQIQETPAYASSFLLTGLLSPDYVDVTGNGITEDDLGNAVKFNYTQSNDVHRWRTPRQNINDNTSNGIMAHYNEGKRSEKRDDKATITYGEREAWYLNSIESKSMIAIFTTTSRKDAKGVLSPFNGRVNPNEDVNKKLSRIDLYTKSDLKANGLANARPIKTVQFYYSYALCKGTPDNMSTLVDSSGKLTLDSLVFSYNGQTRQKRDKYVFGYGNKSAQSDNPSYAANASDRWGTYKPKVDPTTNDNVNPNGLTNIDYPYTSKDKQKSDVYAAVWNLKKILLPSGGQMEIKYEADDYGYVQDRRSADMYTIYGLGNSEAYTSSNSLYQGYTGDNYYVYVKLPKPLTSTTQFAQKAEIYNKYLEGIKQLSFKLQVRMPKGIEPLTVYAPDYDYGLCSNSANNDIIYLKLSPIDSKSPLSKSAISYLVENLPGQAFEGYDVEVNSILDFAGLVPTMLKNLLNAFNNAETQMRSDGKAKTIVLANSFVRLNNPFKAKIGGGYRVKQVLVRDNWDTMAHKYISTYGQDYDYTTIEQINGKDTTISSGVASYEPGIGSEENPFREIISFSNKLPLAPAQYGAVEMPMLDAFYPSPVVGYSKVTVRSIHRKGTHGDSTLRSSIGKQVTEFYTAREYPSYSTYTGMTAVDYHKNPFFSFFYKEIIDRKLVSQGFLVETNDMHGKMKYQAAYSESDDKTPISASYHTYKNTGKNGLNDKVDFVYNNQSGLVQQGNMGVDVELMTDVREFSMQSEGLSLQGQVDIIVIPPITIPIPTLYGLNTYVENKYRAVTCTKLLNYHAIEDSVIVMDKGSIISTKTTAYDAETGTPIVTKTANEFNAPIYNVSYPAYWAYSGMGLAYKNIDATYTASFYDGRISGIDMSDIESGDELYIMGQGNGTAGCVPASGTTTKIWALDINKNQTALTVPTKDLIFIDSAGKLFTKSNVNFRIIRSGHRNLLDAKVGGATLMSDPIVSSGGNKSLSITATSKVVTASAVEFKEKWQTDRGVIKRLSFDPCSNIEYEDCNGYLEKNINPYNKGLIGNYKSNQSLVFYGSRTEISPASQTDISKNGYLANFKHYWNFNTLNNLVPDTTSSQWVWNSQITKVNTKGLELETKNALGIYTAAQYGFNKTIPVAVTNNSRSNETFFEGFEDNSYNEIFSNSNISLCADDKFINLADLGRIKNTDDLSFNAHSGHFVLEMPAVSNLTKLINIKTADIDSFNYRFSKDTSKILTDLGGNSYGIEHYPADSNGFSTSATFNPLSSFGFHLQAYHSGSLQNNSAIAPIAYQITNSQIVELTTNGNYTFSIQGTYLNDGTDDKFYGIYSYITIKDLNDNIIAGGINDKTGYISTIQNKTYTICKGFYKIEVTIIRAYYSYLPSIFPAETPTYNTYLPNVDDITFQCISHTLIGYKSLTTENGCIYTKPITGNDSMFNSTFSVPLNKAMLFSAWVHESGNNKSSFDSNYIVINGSTTQLRPKGAVIDGWQRYEAPFTVTTGTNMTLQFVNNSQLPIYFDDIRIHPFNANMKSYVYDPKTLRLCAELDENNYASFYEYDEEGQLVRVKKETIQGIKTIKETRSAKQKTIRDIIN